MALTFFKEKKARDGTTSTMKTCNPCLVKRKVYRESDHGKAVTKAYNESDAGKANMYRKNHSSARKVYLEEYKKRPDAIVKRRAKWTRWSKTDNGKSTIQDWLKSDVGSASKRKSSAKYKASEKGKLWFAQRKMWLNSLLGAATKSALRKRGTENFREWRKKNREAYNDWRRDYLRRRNKDPAFRLRNAVCRRLWKMMHGYISKTGKTFEYTEFLDSEDAIEHFESRFKEGMERSNYGVFWNHDHLIARKHYDWTDEEDIRRCNSKKNLVPEYVLENTKKGTKLPPPEVLSQLVDVYPKSWNGCVPVGLV